MAKLSKISAALIVSAFLVLSLKPAFGAENLEAAKTRVEAVAKRLMPVTALFARISVIEDTNKNAWVLPDRTIVLTSGLVAACSSDDELAFILAHEEAHVISKDYTRSTPWFTNLSGDPGYQFKEISADVNGAFYAKKAGYDPGASVEILTKLTPEPNKTLKLRIETLSNYLQGGLR